MDLWHLICALVDDQGAESIDPWLRVVQFPDRGNAKAPKESFGTSRSYSRRSMAAGLSAFRTKVPQVSTSPPFCCILVREGVLEPGIQGYRRRLVFRLAGTMRRSSPTYCSFDLHPSYPVYKVQNHRVRCGQNNPVKYFRA